LWAVVSAAYSALLTSSYFERINDDDDDEIYYTAITNASNVLSLFQSKETLQAKIHLQI